MIHVFVLVVVIGGLESTDSCTNGAMCFYDVNRCNYFASRLRRNNSSPSTSDSVIAYCKPTFVDPTTDGLKVY